MRLFSHLFDPFLDWLQVEVTSCCTAHCLYCPHTVFGEFWKAGHMSLETYGKLLPAFRRSALVYLQGWGEPLTHPRFFEMVRMAKQRCHRIGTTTNGMLVDRQAAVQMIREGLFVVCFSLAGTGPFQDGLRHGTSLQMVLKAIDFLNEEKKRLGVFRPKIHVAYMWLRSHRDMVKDLPELLANSGVNQVVVTPLDLVPRIDLAGEVIQAHDEHELQSLRDLAADVRQRGERYGIDIHFQPISSTTHSKTCTENVIKSCFVSFDGWVSPCVFKNLPVKEDRIPQGHGFQFPGHLRFGNIHEKCLGPIWRLPAYRAFRTCHADGKIPIQCSGCPKLQS